MEEMKEIELYFTYPFKNQKFKDFIEQNRSKFDLNEYNELMNNNYKTLVDLELNILNDHFFNVFLDNFDNKLKSKNKGNYCFEIKNDLDLEEQKFLENKKNFFQNNGFYHHHLISGDLYNKDKYFSFNNKTKNYEITDINVIDGLPLSEKIDGFINNKKPQTSNLLIHYQKIGNQYRLLFITEHLISKEWDDLYKKLNIIFKEQD